MDEEGKTRNLDVVLKTYKIISKYLENVKKEEKEQKEEKEEINIEFDLPSPISLLKLCNNNIVKNLLNFDFIKYSSYFEGDILNLDKIVSIKDINITKFLLIFLGYINSKNDIYSLFDESIKSPGEESFIDYTSNYLIYLNLCIDYLKQIKKFFNSINDLDLFLKILSDIGIGVPKEEENNLFNKIKNDLFLCNENNKILILLAPSNNFWIKSQKTQINDIMYDKQLNKYTNIFYNKKFILKFLTRIVSNPRCYFGLINSMNDKHLKECWDSLGKLDYKMNELCPKNIILIAQDLHDQIKGDSKNNKSRFSRNLDKIIEHLKNNNEKNKDSEQENTGYLNEKNILIIESDEEKISNNTIFNSIKFNTFSEEYLQKDEKEKIEIELKIDKLIEYLVYLLNNCGDDIRTFIRLNHFID